MTTGHICDSLATFGASFAAGEIDNRPLPEPEAIETAIACLFEPVTGLLDGCPLAQDLESMLWGLVNAFHAQINRLDRVLDDNERAQARLREQHDGSEVTDTALQDAIDQGRALIDRQNAFLVMFDAAARCFEEATGSTWQPRHGSRPRIRNLTAAMIDSLDFERARRQRWTEDHLPPGPYVVFSGGAQFQEIDAIWQRLDRIRTKHPAMTLLHGGAPGADTIAAKWADNRGVSQIRFSLKRNLGNRAGFERNERMLATCPIGVITFPGSGVTEALKRKARAMGFPLWDYDAARTACGRTADEPEAIIKRLGAAAIARRFGVKETTVTAWLAKGVPASRIDAIKALAS